MSSASQHEGPAAHDSVVLRRRTDDDLATIVGWVPDSRSVNLFAGPSLQWPLTEEQLKAVDAIEGRTAWVIAEGSAPASAVGHADLTLAGERARIGRVIVDPARRGQRLGRTMMLLLLDKARELGATRVDLYVIEGNVPAIRTYQRLGFVDDSPTEYQGMLPMTTDLGAR